MLSTSNGNVYDRVYFWHTGNSGDRIRTDECQVMSLVEWAVLPNPAKNCFESYATDPFFSIFLSVSGLLPYLINDSASLA